MEAPERGTWPSRLRTSPNMGLRSLKRVGRGRQVTKQPRGRPGNSYAWWQAEPRPVRGSLQNPLRCTPDTTQCCTSTVKNEVRRLSPRAARLLLEPLWFEGVQLGASVSSSPTGG